MPIFNPCPHSCVCVSSGRDPDQENYCCPPLGAYSMALAGQGNENCDCGAPTVTLSGTMLRRGGRPPASPAGPAAATVAPGPASPPAVDIQEQERRRAMCLACPMWDPGLRMDGGPSRPPGCAHFKQCQRKARTEELWRRGQCPERKFGV